MRRPFDLYVADGLAILALGTVLLGLPDVVRLLFSIPLVLALPGYALTSAVFVRRVISVPERVLFSLGGSLAVAVLGGILLNLTPLGLEANGWAALLAAVTLAASLIALVRRRRVSEEVPTQAPSQARDWALTPAQTAMFGLAALLIAGAVGVSRVGAMNQPQPSFTQLWLLAAPEQGPNAVRVGIANMESSDTTYDLKLKLNGTAIHEWPSITVKEDDRWEATLVLPTALTGTTVEANLYRSTEPGTVYRYVKLESGTPTPQVSVTPTP